LEINHAVNNNKAAEIPSAQEITIILVRRSSALAQLSFPSSLARYPFVSGLSRERDATSGVPEAKRTTCASLLPLQCQLDVEGDGSAGVDVKYVQHLGVGEAPVVRRQGQRTKLLRPDASAVTGLSGPWSAVGPVSTALRPRRFP